MGELPTPAIGRMLNAVLVSSIDHGVTPPSTLAARNVATTGRAAQGLRGGRDPRVRTASWRRHRVVHAVPRWRSHADARRQDRAAGGGRDRRRMRRAEVEPPGFGHRFHTRDPRAARLFQMALELELEGEHVRLIRATERAHRGARAALRPAAAGQRRRRDRRDQRRPRVCLRARQRDLPDLAAARPDRARARGADAAVADAADRSEGPRLRRRRTAPAARGPKIGLVQADSPLLTLCE